jgi:DNA-directed RNA polymerase subunit RPC12/RpoP
MLDVGKTINAASGVFKLRWGPLVLCTLIYFGVTLLLAAAVMVPTVAIIALTAGGGTVAPTPALLQTGGVQAWQAGVQVVFWPITTFVLMGYLYVLLKADRGETPTASDLFSQKALIFDGMLAWGLFAAFQSIAMTAFVIPWFWWLAACSLSLFFVVDRGLDPYGAVLASEQATRGQRWKMVVLGLVLFGISMGGYMACCVGLVAAVPFAGLIAVRAYTTLADDQVRCADCKNRNSILAKSCGHCGSLVEGFVEGGKTQPHDQIRCRHCGSQINRGLDRCPLCAEFEPALKEAPPAPPVDGEPTEGEIVGEPVTEPESAPTKDGWRLEIPAHAPTPWHGVLALLILIPVMSTGGSPIAAAQTGYQLAPALFHLPPELGIGMGLGLLLVPALGAIILLRHRHVSSQAIDLDDRAAVFGRTKRWPGYRIPWTRVAGFRIRREGVLLQVTGLPWTRLIGPTVRTEDRQVHDVVVELERLGLNNLAG